VDDEVLMDDVQDGARTEVLMDGMPAGADAIGEGAVHRPSFHEKKGRKTERTNNRKGVVKRPAAARRKCQGAERELLSKAGWRIEVRVRASGTSKGHRDSYCWSPIGTMYRSVAEIKAAGEFP